MSKDYPRPHLYCMGDRIKKLREEKGLLQRELASRTGLTKAAIYHAEAATRELKATALGAVAEVLGVSADYLLHGESVKAR
jgi:transcriptional regulator with XRE-family HTH domain